MKQLRLLLSVLALLCVGLLHAQTVSDVTFTPRYPWNGLVDIAFTLNGTIDAGKGYYISLTGYDQDRDETVVVRSVTGPTAGFSAPGTYHVVWDAAADCPEYASSSFQITATLHEGEKGTLTYLVVDLSGGTSATSYPVRYTNDAPDLSDDTCRTTELWLRRIPAGTFTMGSPEDELGRGYGETQHQVTLTRDYYVGVFEVTQKQYMLVTGSNPSYYQGDTRPVVEVSYDDLRGTSTEGWPTYGHKVDATSFFGILRSKTGLVFDLPTEAQWEYACRAGTTTALNSGKNLTSTPSCPNMAEVGRYIYNNRSDGKGGYGIYTKVGSYLPNAWGLYDMHGNVWEWCLDWNGDCLAEAVADPAGPSTGSCRVLRGGGWSSYAQDCRSASRDISYPSGSDYDYGYGFRVACWPPVR